MNDLENIPIPLSMVNDKSVISLLLYGIDKFHDTKNTKNRKILISSIRFIKDSQRFDEELFC